MLHIYADDDISSIVDDKDDTKDRSYDSLEKLHGLTVLEDDNMGDDEDLMDTGDDAESGDWYPDYDKRAQHVSTFVFNYIVSFNFILWILVHVTRR
ncbi:hypothetical protein HF086_015911 [Spodoptera exigua]|uniref:Uncharacterized protein n=1 Tax=Spodoptera exigua TaxID=7107 RepID=A0A922S813_SPOEX|nr:hypothetical protein HF086_015911 [Spodoptera exigua]